MSGADSRESSVCSHRAESLVSAPIYGVVGGLHLPVDGLRAQDVIGTAKWPWERTSESEVEQAIDLLQRRSPRLIALSWHDSPQWTLSRFEARFGERFRTGTTICSRVQR